MEFIYDIARNAENFAMYGSDLLFCFAFVASTSGDERLRRSARKKGRERARQWRRDCCELPPKADADTVFNFVQGDAAADRLGILSSTLKGQIQQAAGSFSARDYFGFDPVSEPPPSDLPDQCDCGATNDRGRKFCRNCRRRLTMMSRYEVWYQALTRTYIGDTSGVMLGSRYVDVIKWLPALRPYPVSTGNSDPEFYDTVYCVTHVIYTLNDYSHYRLLPHWLPEEFEFLKIHLREAIARNDPEMVGEFLDTLGSFGLSNRHPLIRTGAEYLLSQQNADGSWGELTADDIYNRYHSTWTAVDGLREYAWRGKATSYQRLKPLLRGWAGKESRR